MDNTVLRKKGGQRKRIETPAWLVTYGDMITLLLAFFIALFTVATIDGYEIQLILSAFPGIGNFGGGNTLQEGPLPELGYSILSLPAQDRRRQLDQARVKERNQTFGKISTRNFEIREEERGLVVSLAADLFFASSSAEIDIDNNRDILQEIALFLQNDRFTNRKFRIEGHTDSIPPNPDGEWNSNWDLSAARSINILRVLSDYGVNESQFQIMGLSDTAPIADNSIAEGRARNRRVDIVILNDGRL